MWVGSVAPSGFIEDKIAERHGLELAFRKQEHGTHVCEKSRGAADEQCGKGRPDQGDDHVEKLSRHSHAVDFGILEDILGDTVDRAADQDDVSAETRPQGIEKNGRHRV